jgi:protein-tyrosine phosphatase
VVTLGTPYRVVFVCTGNICRSPSAEAVLKQRVHEAGLSDVIAVSSAGMAGWHVGKDADPRSLAALRARGYDLAHSARQVRRSWVDEHDLFVALDSGHLMELRSLLPGVDARLLRDWDPRGSGNVPDPYYDGPEVFEEVLDIIERSCDGLLAELRQRLAA